MTVWKAVCGWVMIVLVASMSPLSAATPQGLEIAAAPIPLADLDLRDAKGNTLHLADFKGHPLLLNLWASWCAPCVAELPALDRLYQKQDGSLAILALSLDRGGLIAAQNTYHRLGISHLPLAIDDARQSVEAWHVPTLPTTLLIDAEGREIGRFIGSVHWDQPQAEALLNALRLGQGLKPTMAPPVLRLNSAP